MITRHLLLHSTAGDMFILHITTTGPHSQKDLNEMLVDVARRKGTRLEAIEVSAAQAALYQHLSEQLDGAGVPSYLLGRIGIAPRLRLVG